MEVMIGGRLLGKGVYGCVFEPPLKCQYGKNPKGPHKVGKLTESESLQNELLAYTTFKNKPEATKYLIFGEMNTFCKKGPKGEPAIDLSGQTEQDLKKCELIKEDGIENLYHYQMENGGPTLYSKLNNVNMTPKDFPFIQFMQQMLEIGAFMVMNGFIHQDLHIKNIVVDKNFKFRLIDFGRCYTAGTITDDVIDSLKTKYSPRHGQVTPEYTIQEGLWADIPLKKIFEDIKYEKEPLKMAQRLFGQSRDEQMVELKQFWRKSRSVQEGDFTKFWKTYWPAVDAWAIGDVLSITFYKLSLSNQFMKSPEIKARYSVIKGVICGLLKASPLKRIDCLQALALFDPTNQLVSSASGKAWLSKK